MSQRLFTLFFLCTLVGTFTSGFAIGKRLQGIQDATALQVQQLTKTNKS